MVVTMYCSIYYVRQWHIIFIYSICSKTTQKLKKVTVRSAHIVHVYLQRLPCSVYLLLNIVFISLFKLFAFISVISMTGTNYFISLSALTFFFLLMKMVQI